MTTGFQELRDEQLIHALEDLLVPRLKEIIASRGLGHCMRVADLDLQLMVALTRSLRRELPDAQIFILEGDRKATTNPELYVSSTKLVELRNPLPDESLRPPLLVFLPSNLQTNAEDSFNVASFEEISVADVYQELVQTLIQRVPAPLRGYVKDICSYLASENWAWADPVAQARFLLAAIANEIGGDTLGAALYELGLVPDFYLFEEPSTALGRIHKNLESMRKLTLNLDKSIRGRVLDLELTDQSVQNRLIQFLVEVGVEAPRSWTRQVVLNRNNWDISFDKWTFQEDFNPDEVSIEVLQMELPVVPENTTDERLQSLIGEQVLVPKEQRTFKVSFKVEPHPQQVQGLDYFTVQIFTQDGGTVGVVKKVKVWKAKSLTKSVSLDKLDRFDFEEGWHFVRVLPWTANGDPIPLAPSRERAASTEAKLNESELFYALPEGDIDEEPRSRTTPQETSLEHAKLRLQFQAVSEGRDPYAIALKDVVWGDKKSQRRGAAVETLEAKFGSGGNFRIPVAQFLKLLEQQVLASPERPISWQLPINLAQVGSFIEDIVDWPKSAAASSFLSARSDYFAAIRAGDKELISQAANFTTLKDICFEYAAAYRDLLVDLCRKIERSAGADQQSLSDLKKVLAVDTVRLTIKDFRGTTQEAVLVGPTHPLRALWLVTWSQVAQSWVEAAQNGSEEYISFARDGILRGLVPLNVPATQSLADGRVFVTVDNIHPFWLLYAPSTEENARGLLGEVCAAFGLPEPTIGGTAVTGDVLASRIERYLAQHPYIRTLSINAFNSGRAAVLAEALISLQKQEAFRHLRYDIRLFVPEPEAPGVGEAIEQLLTSSGAVSSEVVDAFSTSSGSHLFPKLNLAVHSLQDFRSLPDAYPAHLGMLFDLFPAEEIGSAPAFGSKDVVPLHGLIQDFVLEFQDDESGTLWRRQSCHGKALTLPGAENIVDLLADLPKLISGATAAVATGIPAFENRPVVTLGLKPEQRKLMQNIHDVCDWVFTIDRNIGIEFFDRGGESDRPPYLVDYTPDATASFGHQLVISSRSLSELESILFQVLEKYGLKADKNQIAIILEQLRSLSGRLALKIISSPQQQAEVLGLALARRFLEYQGALSNQIVVPLDAHLDLFRATKQYADELGEAVSLQRTDLALFDLNVTTRTILCNLVEVKCYTKVGSVSNFNELKQEAADQLQHSESALRRHFEFSERPDRLLKTREFATLLNFYLDRSLRYEMIDEEAAEEARILLATLEEGYSLQFTRSGLIFDFEKQGTEPPEYEQGIEFHRIGIDLMEALMALAKPVAGVGKASTSEIPQEQNIETEKDSIPRLTSAAFIVAPRERSTSWDELILEKDQGTAPAEEQVDVLTPTASQELDSVVQSPSLDLEAKTREKQPNISFPTKPQQDNEQQDASTSSGVIESKPQDEPVSPAPSEVKADEALQTELDYDIMLGVQSQTPQYGILGEVSGRKVALDLNQTHTISLFGVQGAGKSYTLGSIVEMACLPIPNINVLPSPLTTIIFHYSPTQDYKPEFTSMVKPNSEASQLEVLRERYGAEPAGLNDVVIFVPPSKVEERKSEYPDIEVLPITFAASELKAMHWRFLMGAVGSQSMYLRQINLIMRKLRDELTLEGLFQGIESSSLSDHLKDLARTRLEFAAEYIDDSRRLSDLILPGRLAIVDLRDEFIEKDEALGLFVVLLQICSEATDQGRPFNKFVVFDEAHKYVENAELVAGLIEIVREMRHKGTSIMVASQDPPSVPVSLIELSSQIILHRFNSPNWLKHIQRANAALNSLTPEQMSQLGPGEAYVWSGKASDESFTKGAVKIYCRPRVTQHGGSTKTAVIVDVKNG